VEDGLVAGSEFVVSGGHGAVAFESVDAALDGMTLPVVQGAECRRPPAMPASLGAVSGLVGFDGDRALDAAPAQVA
jgi:hypothetical protein